MHQKGEGDQWLVYIDKSSAQEGGGARILLVGLEKEFRFSITNNMAEHEALLSSLRLTKKVRAKKVMLFTDSQLSSASPK